MRLSRRQCWALGAVFLSAGLVLPWAAARVDEAAVVPVVETVRLRPALVRLPGGSFLMGGNVGEDEPTAVVVAAAAAVTTAEIAAATAAAVAVAGVLKLIEAARVRREQRWISDWRGRLLPALAARLAGERPYR